MTKSENRFEAESAEINKLVQEIRSISPYVPETEGQADLYPALFTKNYGDFAATLLRIGCVVAEECIRDDMDLLAKMPRGSHIGMLESSWVRGLLPKQFLTRYDHEFLCKFQKVMDDLLDKYHKSNVSSPERVIEKHAIYVILETGYQFLRFTYREKIDQYEEYLMTTRSLYQKILDIYNKIDDEHWNNMPVDPAVSPYIAQCAIEAIDSIVGCGDVVASLDLFWDLWDGALVDLEMFTLKIIDEDSTYHFDHWFDLAFKSLEPGEQR